MMNEPRTYQQRLCQEHATAKSTKSVRPWWFVIGESTRRAVAMTTAAVLQQLLLLLLLRCVLLWGVCDPAAAVKTRRQYGQYDAFVVARCEAHCWMRTEKDTCIRSCLSKPFNKPGRCPKNHKMLTPFDSVCLDTCHQDSQCFALTKCCRHTCGITCQYPEELSSAVGVPDVPQDIKVMEGQKKRNVTILWNSGRSLEATTANDTIVYIIEERHHTGRNFIENHLSEWSFCAKSVKENHTLKNFIKPGRWYQFRVAAINENGTKGFSENSPTFNIAIRPKPPKEPENVTFTALRSNLNGSLIGEVRWLPPSSDLPIQRYKVFWSRRLEGARPLQSVLVHQQVVPKEQHKFLLQNLQPNSFYFLQIQALVQYGRKRLKSRKAGIVLNTANYTNVPQTLAPSNPDDKNKIQGIRVQKMYWSQGGLRVRIIWKPKNETTKYTITLWTGPCHKSAKSRKYFQLAATTKAAHFDLYDLQFSCKYKVGVRSIFEEDLKSVKDTCISFLTPNCLDFKKKNRKARCTI